MSAHPFATRGLALALLGTAINLSAQELPWVHVTPDHPRIPLPSASVQTVDQDREGYVWLGFFSAGLARYDGRRLDVYSVGDGLPDSTVRQVVQDSGGRLWVGCESGLVVSERPLASYAPGERIRFVDRVGATELLRGRIRHGWMGADGDGDVWVGTAGDGLHRYRVENGRLEASQVSVDLGGVGRNEVVSTLLVKRDGGVLVATEEGSLGLLPPGAEVVSAVPQASVSGSVVTALHEEPDGTIWAGCRDGEIWRLPPGGRREVVSRLLTERVSDIVGTREGVLWASSLGAGLLRLEPRNNDAPRRIASREGLLSESVWELMEDREGNLWVAHNAGVSRLRANYRAFSSYTGYSRAGERPVLPEPTVFSVLPPSADARPDYLWVGTGGGLAAVARNGTSTWLGVRDGLPSGSIYSLSRDGDGRVWVGTLAGLAVLSFDGRPPNPLPGTASLTATVHGVAAHLTTFPLGTVYEAKVFPLAGGAGETVESVWITGPSGLACYVGGEWFLFRTGAGLPASGTGTVAVDPSGTVWVGTRDHGVLRSRGGITLAELRRRVGQGREVRTTLFDPAWDRAQGAPSSSIHNLAWTGDRMWVATPSGLAALGGEPLSSQVLLGSTNGLGGDRVLGMATNPRDGTLWVTQNDGVACVDPRSGKILKRVSRLDGLVDNEVWVSSSLAAGDDGTIYLATPRGLSIYRPSLDSTPESDPVLRFARFSFTRRGGGENELLVEYRALSYTCEERVRFRSRLVGYDRGWSEPTTETRIRYTNLPAFILPRTYVFEFAAGTGERWSAPLARSVTVSPPWYVSWWAALLYLGFLAGGVTAYSRRLRNENRGLEERVEARTTELRRAFSERRAERGEVEESLAGSSRHLTDLSAAMRRNAEETSMQAQRVATAAAGVNDHVQAVSAAVEQLSASARDIAGNASEAASIASEAVTRGEAAHAIVTSLGTTSAEIGRVTDIIAAIAKQTNLLALNATIEAAHAGDRGRGFGVVASEVRELARRTAQATEEVRRQVEGIQADSGRAVSAIGSIREVIEHIDEIQLAIASAVEEHTATTAEIGRTVSSAAAGSAEITAGMEHVADAARETTAGATATQETAAELAALAARLRDALDEPAAQV